LRILHVWDQAGTASVIAREQRKLGHHSLVIKNSKHDFVEITKYYGGMLVKNKYHFVIKSIFLARKFDIIHLHDAWFMVVPLRILYPQKKIIMHYHGSLVRNEMKGEKMRLGWEKLVNAIIVATPDLLEFEYSSQPYYIPNPVDTILFHKRSIPHNNKCFSSMKKGTDKNQIFYMLSRFDFEVDLQQNKNRYVDSIKYKNFNKKLEQYEYYADLPVINGKLIHANSVCGLQAMSMGLKVVNWDYTISDSLPEYHRPENVVKEIEKIYQQQ